MSGIETTATPAVITRERRRPAARLVVVHPPELARAVPLESARVRLGRVAAECDVVIVHPTVSRLHLTITWELTGGRHVATDAGSKNGTWIDGARVTGAARVLADGAVLRLGDVVVVYEEGTSLDLEDPSEVSREAIPGDSAAARVLRVALAKAGADPAPVLITGETGTGKEQIARELHRLGRRRGPFVAVSCAELSGELTESRLFGHARGAFTGAQGPQPGLIRSAEGGTLLLDEIGELSPALQPKLLRTLQESEVLPVGETRPVRVDVRFIAATHRDLAQLVEDGTFRRDLHARLAFWEIPAPPLRARRADVMTWIARLHARYLERRPAAPRAPLTFASDAVEGLLLAPWLENLRGLDKLVLRLATHPPGTLLTRVDVESQLAPEGPAPSEPPENVEVDDRPPPPASREEMEALLAQHDGKVYALARHYRRDRRQIYRWLRAFGLR